MSKTEPAWQLDVMQLPHGAGLPLPAYQSADAAGSRSHGRGRGSMRRSPSRPARAPSFRPAWRSPCRPAPRDRCGPARAWRRGMASPFLMRPEPSIADYRGEIQVILVNFGQESFTVTRGMRIAQLIIAPVLRVTIRAMANLDETTRGVGGFGSTGMKNE